MRLKIFFTLWVIATLSLSSVRAQQTVKITAAGTGYLEYLPEDYNQNQNKYPIVIFLHGIGEKGTTSTDPETIMKSVMDEVSNVALPKYIKYGAQYPFIVISPQLKSSYSRWTSGYVMEVLNHVKKYLRIDENRIYLTGLSLGGYGVWTTIGDYPEVFAAIVPVCSGGSALSKACDIASANVPIWAFHGEDDKTVSYTVTTKMINAVNNCSPKPNPLAKVTLFPGMGHSIWDKVYKSTDALNWMTSFTKDGSRDDSGSDSDASAPVGDEVPVSNAGPDQTLTLPENSIVLNGSGTDADGTIAYYAWWQVSGPSEATLNYRAQKSLHVSDLVEGTYTFRLKVTDNDENKGFDDVNVIVKPGSSSNSLPTVSAGGNQTITLPADYVYLQGTASDADGTIASYKWTKISGGTASISGATSARAKAYNLEASSYVFRLTVQDNDGGSRYDDVTVTVKSGANILPVANAGPNRFLTLPSNSLTLNGSASDEDGKIVSYEWEQIKGPTVNLTNENTPNVQISNFVAGAYYFKLTVKDDQGGIDVDKMLVKVYP